MTHSLHYIDGANKIDISSISGAIAWGSHRDQLGSRLDFTVADSDGRFFPDSPVDIGGMVVLENNTTNKETLRCMVVAETGTGRKPKRYSAFDYGFYLNKSKATHQFKKTPANTAMEQVLKRAGVDIGEINIPSTPIDTIYPDRTHSEIIKDILRQIEDKDGIRCTFEFVEGKIYIQKEQNKIIEPKIKLANNIASMRVTDLIGSPTIKKSIEDTKNSIKIITNEDDVISNIYETSDSPSIDKYGLLQEIITISNEDKLDAAKIGDNKLNELNKMLEEVTIPVLGHDDLVAHRVLQISEPITRLEGNFVIDSADHTISNGIHLCNLKLEGLNG